MLLSISDHTTLAKEFKSFFETEKRLKALLKLSREDLSFSYKLGREKAFFSVESDEQLQVFKNSEKKGKKLDVFLQSKTGKKPIAYAQDEALEQQVINYLQSSCCKLYINPSCANYDMKEYIRFSFKTKSAEKRSISQIQMYLEYAALKRLQGFLAFVFRNFKTTTPKRISDEEITGLERINNRGLVRLSRPEFEEPPSALSVLITKCRMELIESQTYVLIELEATTTDQLFYHSFFELTAESDVLKKFKLFLRSEAAPFDNAVGLAPPREGATLNIRSSGAQKDKQVSLKEKTISLKVKIATKNEKERELAKEAPGPDPKLLARVARYRFFTFNPRTMACVESPLFEKIVDCL